MHVVAISCVRDELDIIEPFVRHTLAHVDRLVVLDNGSSDGTRELLQLLVEEGLPLEVIDDPSTGNYQWVRMTNLMRGHAIQKYSADWVVPLDADEFLMCHNLSKTLQRVGKSDEPVGIRWTTYVPHADDSPDELNPVLRIRHRLCREARPTVKVIVPSNLGRDPGVVLSQGSHTLEANGLTLASPFTKEISYAHFPSRSAAQYARKAAIKHLQYLAMSDRMPNWGYHYRPTLKLLRQNLFRLEAEFQEAIQFFNLHDGVHSRPELVAAPLDYQGGPLKYTREQTERPFAQSLFQCAEVIADAHGKLSRDYRQLQAELQQREAALAAIRRSWSWRVGRTVTTPVRWLKQCFGGMRLRSSSTGNDASRAA